MAITIPVRLQGQATASGNSVNFDLSLLTTPVPGLPGVEIANNIIIDFTSAGSVVPGLPDVDDINGFGPLADLSSPPPATPDVQLPTSEFSFLNNLELEYTGEDIIVTPGEIVEAEYEIFGGDFVISFGTRTLDLNGDGTAGTGELKLIVPEETKFLVEYIGATELPPETPPEGAIELQFQSFVDSDGDGLLNQAYWMFDADPNNRETFDGNPANQIPDDFFVDNIEIPAGTYLATAFQLIAESLQDPDLGNISDWALQSQGIFYETVDIDAKITIEPDDTNAVGDDHTFTVTVWVDDGTGSDVDGEMGTFDRVGVGEEVTVTLTDQFGAMNVPSTPLAGVTDADGEFEVTFTSPTAGQVIGSATTTVNVRGFDLTRTTDGIAPNSGPATKTFVDAKIIIGPDGENLVQDPHTFTTTVWVDDGTGTDADGQMGNFDRFEGAPVEVTLTNQGGAVADPAGPFNGNTDADGEFDVTFTSATPGQVIGNATTTVNVGGVSLTRSTDGVAPNSGPATKTFIERAMLGDFVWEDLDADGIQDAGEPGIAGVKVTLTGGGPDGVIGTPDDTMAMQFTDANGLYKFNDLIPGVEYKVTFTNPDDMGPDAYMFSPRQVGADPAVDSDGPMSDIVTLAPGQFNDTIDAGLFRKGSIHAFGFLDADRDGMFDPLVDAPFPDVPGKTFVLEGDVDGDGISDTVTQTTMNGMVWFEGLTPGTYSVREDPIPAGYELTTPPNLRTFTVLSGQELVYEDGAAMLPPGDERMEVNLGDDLRWGNALIEVTGNEGCTPGFWKSNAANFARKPDKFGVDTDGDGINDAPAAWAPTGVAPSDPLLSVGFMGFTVQDGDDTFFVDALDANGGGENALMRHAAAAYLNAVHPDIDYAITSFEIVASVNFALGTGDRFIIEDLKDELDRFNNAFCSIDQFGRPMDDAMYR